jgi:hypothetical protein
MRNTGAVEHVRYLTERLNRANGIRRVEPDLADTLLCALPPFVSGNDPLRVSLTTAALAALEEQNTLTRAVLDDHLCRALEIYLALPTPGGPSLEGEKVVHRRRPKMAGARKLAVSKDGGGSKSLTTARHEKDPGGES